jgi:hypothetical protein
MYPKHDNAKSAKVCVKSDKKNTFLSIKPTYFYDQSVTNVFSVTTVIMVTLVIKDATDFLVITLNVVTNVPITEPGLRRRSAAARLLGLWVRIPLGALMSVFSESCVSSGRVLCDRQITSPEESYRLWCV